MSYLFPLLACFAGTAHNDKLKLWFHGNDMEGLKLLLWGFERTPAKSTLDRSSLLRWLNLVPMH